MFLVHGVCHVCVMPCDTHAQEVFESSPFQYVLGVEGVEGFG